MSKILVPSAVRLLSPLLLLLALFVSAGRAGPVPPEVEAAAQAGLADPTAFRPVRGGLWWIKYSSLPVGSVAFSAQSTDSMPVGATSY